MPAENVIGWKAAVVRGMRRLTEVRIREDEVLPEGEWGERVESRIRVMRPGSWQLYVHQRDAPSPGWYLDSEGRTSLDYVPFVTVYTGRTGFMTAEPPLLDLAWLNLLHYQSSSEQRHGLAVVRRPTLTLTGFRQDATQSIELGPHNAIVAENPEAKVGFAEPTAAGVGAGRQDLEDLKAEMATLGLELLVRRPGNVTATETAIKTAEATSDLTTMAQNLQDGLETGLQFLADYGKLGAAGSVVLSRDLGLTGADAAFLAALTQARASRDISRIAYLNRLAAVGVLSDDFDPETDAEALEAEVAL